MYSDISKSNGIKVIIYGGKMKGYTCDGKELSTEVLKYSMLKERRNIYSEQYTKKDHEGYEILENFKAPGCVYTFCDALNKWWTGAN